MLNIIRKNIRVDGRVQGVGFRWYVRLIADGCHLTGYVTNLYDGSVEVEVQGAPEDIDKFTGLLFKGNGYSRIDDYKELKIEADYSERRFRIV